MPSHRGQTRREGHRPAPGRAGRTPSAVARGVSVEEGLLPEVDLLPRPAGFGTEASRSAQSFALVDEYEVPADTVALIQVADLSIEANGEAKVSVAGTTYGPFTGATDVSVPLDRAALSPGHKIRVHHQSTDGTSTTTRAQVVVVEV